MNMDWIKNKIICLIIIVLSGCNSGHVPELIEKHIMSNNNEEFISLSEAIGVDFDTLYLFESLTNSYSGIRNITCVSYFKADKDPGSLYGSDIDMKCVLLKKGDRIVFEDEYYDKTYRVFFATENMEKKEGVGFFDGSPMTEFCYYCTNKKVKVCRGLDNCSNGIIIQR